MRTKETKEKILRARELKNKNFLHSSFEMETSTHFPILLKVVQATSGSIVEVGSGLFSTPLLHWLCFEKKRRLVTLERYIHYSEFAKKFISENHYVITSDVDNFIKKFENKYSVIFIDHSPKKPTTRGSDALYFKDIADYIILHDAGPDPKDKYGYKEIYPYFKYIYHYTKTVPHTTVLSNFKELKWLEN